MAIGYNGGVADNSKIGTNTAGDFRFIPVLWSSRINKAFYDQTVLGEITNNDYSGEISGMGDKVVIANSPTISIADYAIGDGITYARPPVNTTELVIDKAKSFAYKANDIERHQAKVEYMSEFADAAANQLKVVVDADVLTSIVNDPQAANKGVAAGARSGQLDLGAAGGTNGSNAEKIVPGTAGAGEANVFDYLTRLSATMDEAKVPESGRWVVIPPLFRQKLVQSGQALALIQGGETGQYRNGKIGRVDNLDIYVSNQLLTATEGTATLTYLLAGHSSAICFASQISKVENMRDPNDFGDLVRGLNVYGFKTIKPEALVTGVVHF